MSRSHVANSPPLLGTRSLSWFATVFARFPFLFPAPLPCSTGRCSLTSDWAHSSSQSHSTRTQRRYSYSLSLDADCGYTAKIVCVLMRGYVLQRSTCTSSQSGTGTNGSVNLDRRQETCTLQFLPVVSSCFIIFSLRFRAADQHFTSLVIVHLSTIREIAAAIRYHHRL